MNTELRQAIQARATLARDGFMSRCVDAVPSGHRAPFCCELLPTPSVSQSQWDHADNTARALRAWYCVRQITGDQDTGRAIEAGLWQHLQSVIHPATGLAFVPEFSHDGQGPFYYHTWDQGRLFDYLVLRWSAIVTDASDKAALLARIRRLQHGLRALSTTATQADGTVARWWPAEVYFDAAPQPESGNCGPHDFRGWCIGAAQFLPPQVRLAALTGDPADLALALEMARGFLAGYERRRGSTAPMFATDGQFAGHFHGAVSGLDGVLQLAVLLYRAGDAALATEWIELAVRVYGWIFDPTRNANPGSTCGCFSETARAEPHFTSEMCCTADMLEFAAHLAECAALHPRWAALADAWDDVERFTRGEVFKTQVTNLERLAALVIRPASMTPEQALTMLRRQEGSWIFGRPFLHDLLGRQRPASIHTAAWLEVQADARAADEALVPVLRGAGCCAYSGVRALHVAWHHAAAHVAGVLELRLPLAYQDATLTVTPLADGAGLRLMASAPRTLRVRVPRYLEDGSVSVTGTAEAPTWSDDRRWLTLTLAAGQAAAVNWRPRAWTTTETFGPRNELGVVPGVGRDERVRCTLYYHGAELVHVAPGHATLPLEKGL